MSGGRAYAYDYGQRDLPEMKTVEYYFNDVDTILPSAGAATSTDPSTAAFPGMVCVNNIAKGNGYNERVGNTVTVRSVAIHAYICNVDGGATLKEFGAAVRCLLVYDKQVNGAYPTVCGSAFPNILAAIGGSDFTSHLHPLCTSRYEILKDEVVLLSYMLPGAYVNWYWKGALRTEYKGTTATIASMNCGALYFICFCDHPTVANYFSPALHSGQSKVRYTDE